MNIFEGKTRMSLVAATVLLAVACSDKDPLQPTPDPDPDPETCTLASLNLSWSIDPLEPERLRLALDDAATRLAGGLDEGSGLGETLADLHTISAGSNDLALCQAFNDAVDGLLSWEAEREAGDAGWPDASMIRQTLGLYEAAVREHRGGAVSP